MKKIISLTVTFFIILYIITTNSFAQSSLPPEGYKAYFDTVYKLVYGDETDENIGVGIFDSYKYYYSENEYSFDIDNGSGLAFADLIDFDNNGIQELFLFYITPGENFTYEIYGYNENGLIKIHSKQGSLIRDFSFDLVYKNNKTYIMYATNNKIYQDGGGFDYGTDIEYISIENNKIKTEEFSEFHKNIGEDYYKYKKSQDSSEQIISESDANIIKDKWNGEKTSIIYRHHPQIFEGVYISDLNYCDNSKTIITFLDNLLDNSSPNYTFEDVTNIFTKAEYDSATDFLSTFLDDFVRFTNYDKNNIDEGSILEFIFDIAGNNDLKFLSSKYLETGNMQISSLNYNAIQKYIKEYFGIELNLEENKTYSFDEYEETTNTFVLKNGIVTRKGIDDTNKGGIAYSHIIKKIYNLNNSYYLLDINEEFAHDSEYEEFEPSLNKFYAIIQKLDNGKFNLIKIQNQPFNNQDEIIDYMKILSPGIISKSSSSSNIIILTSILAAVVVLILGLLIILKKNLSKATIIIALLISMLIGIGVYFVLHNKETSSNNNSINLPITNEVKKDDVNITEIQEESINQTPESPTVETFKPVDDAEYIEIDSNQLIKEKIKSYEKSYVEAVNSGDFYKLEPNLLPDGTMYNQFYDIVNDYYSRNLKLILYDHKVDSIVDLGDGEYKVNIYEKFGVINDGSEKIKEFDSIYTVKIINGTCYMKDILL